MKRFFSLVAFLIISLFSLSSHAAGLPTQYDIENVKDNVYRFTAGNYKSVFMVTDDGIIVTDPINPLAAAYLKKELKKQFDKPIKYMIYSHNHVDHSMGGKALAGDGVEVVAQRYAAEDIIRTKVPTAKPTMTFQDHMEIALGDSRVELQYHGVNNGRGSVSMRFMPANVMYVVDWMIVGRMPYKNLIGYDIHGMIDSTREVLAMPPFDVFVGGHADIGTRKDVEHYLGYIEALYNAVRDGMVEGKDLKTLQAEIKLPDYKDLKMYEEWLPLNIEGVYNTLVNMSYFNFRSDIDAEF